MNTASNSAPSRDASTASSNAGMSFMKPLLAGVHRRASEERRLDLRTQPRDLASCSCAEA
jgi:hypothetical protein